MSPKSLLLIGGGALLLAALILPGQDGRQEWTLSPNNGSTVRFSIERWKPGSHSRTTTDVPFERFRGLSRDAFDRGGPARFEYAHDAGRLICEGRFSFGRGSGKFTFSPDPDFVAALTRLGYDAPGENDLFTMLLMGVGLADAEAANDAGLRASTQQLIEMRIHGIDPAYIRAVHESGFRPSSSQDLIQMKIHGVSAEYVRDAKALGYDFTPRELIDLKIHGVDGRYLRRVRDSGMRNLNAEQIQKLKIHGID